jgi:hypothetical protein
MPDMTRREEAIEAIMAMAALAAQNPNAVATGSGPVVIFSALTALTMLGVSDREIADVALKSDLTNGVPDRDKEDLIESLRNARI